MARKKLFHVLLIAVDLLTIAGIWLVVRQFNNQESNSFLLGFVLMLAGSLGIFLLVRWYKKALNAAILRASIPYPGAISIGRVQLRTARGAPLVSIPNAQTLIFSAMLHVLLANPTAETKKLRDKVRPAEERCMREIQQRYGFRPVSPYQPGKANKC